MASYEEAYNTLLKEIRVVARYKHRYDVFRDFVTMSAIALANAVQKREDREDEYLRLIATYERGDQLAFPKLLGCLVKALEYGPRDVLGSLYMDLELGSKDRGQFFTPFHVSEMMAEIVHGEELKSIEKPFITLSEPACGAGGMVLAFVKVMLKYGHNPAERLWVQCIDVDRLAALMCFVQLTLWNVPAEVLVGNALSLEIREVWHTPQHILGFWQYRLAQQNQDAPEHTRADSDIARIPKTTTNSVAGPPSRPVQFDFGF
jgi:hypothetical protein